VEGYEPPQQVIEDVERIVELAGVEVGGIEYVIDDRTGRQLYYDVNALSNFVCRSSARHRLQSLRAACGLSHRGGAAAPSEPLGTRGGERRPR